MSSAGHFYDVEGKPQHEGGIKAARENGRLPSATTITHIINKESINQYRIDQMMQAALTLPRGKDESDKEFINRLYEDAKAHQEKAATRGTMVHNTIQHFITTGQWKMHWMPKDLQTVSEKIIAVLDELNVTGYAEVPFANLQDGYGGTIDFLGWSGPNQDTPTIIDYKTQDIKHTLKSGKGKFNTYPEWAMQLAAYRRAASLIPNLSGFLNAKCYSLVISSNSQIADVKLKEWPETHRLHMNLDRALKQFLTAKELYYLTYNLEQREQKHITTTPLNELRLSA